MGFPEQPVSLFSGPARGLELKRQQRVVPRRVPIDVDQPDALRERGAAVQLGSLVPGQPGTQPADEIVTGGDDLVQVPARCGHRAVGGQTGRPGGEQREPGGREAGHDLVIQQEYVADLKEQAARAIDTFNVADVFKSVDPTNPWAIFRGYLDGVATQAANAVVPRWIDRLGGADVYTLPNAYQLVESLRIDYGHLGAFGIHP